MTAAPSGGSPSGAGSRAGGGTTAAALRWTCGLLRDCGIPFQVTGDVAAAAHGGTRPVRRVEMFIAAAHVPALIRQARDRVADYPWRRRDDAWDRVALVLVHDGVTIEVGIVEAARFREAATGEWRDAAIEPEASVTMTVWDIETPVMPREQLVDQKRRLDREIDRQDLRDITGGAE